MTDDTVIDGTVRHIPVPAPGRPSLGATFAVGMKQLGVPYRLTLRAKAPKMPEIFGQSRTNATGITRTPQALVTRFG